MPLGTEVDPRAGHIVLDGFQALRERCTASPSFRPMSIVATVAHLSYCWALVWSSAGCANRRVTDRKASFATQFMYTKFDNNRSRLCHGNDGPVVNLHACHRNIASGWHQSLHAQCTAHTHSACGRGQWSKYWTKQNDDNATYRITCKQFFFQALSGVTLWRLFNQMKSS